MWIERAEHIYKEKGKETEGNGRTVNKPFHLSFFFSFYLSLYGPAGFIRRHDPTWPAPTRRSIFAVFITNRHFHAVRVNVQQ